MDLHDVANEVCIAWKKDTWVAVIYEKLWYPGVIVEVTILIFLECQRNMTSWVP